LEGGLACCQREENESMTTGNSDQNRRTSGLKNLSFVILAFVSVLAEEDTEEEEPQPTANLAKKEKK
jgi:hypothetical protein